MKDLWLVAIGAGTWQSHGIEVARAQGIRVLALDGDPAAPGLRAADLSYLVDIRDENAVIEAVRLSGIKASGAISLCSEAGMNAAAAVREAFDLAGPRADLTYALTNKARQRALWRHASVPGPHWHVAENLPEARRWLKEIGFPAIVKPVDSAGSRGVTKVESESEIEPAILAAFEHSLSKKVIVESILAGTEYTVETFSQGGVTHVLAVTGKKKVTGTRGTVAIELATPDLPTHLITLLGDTAVAALTALGHIDGPGHSELITNDDGCIGVVETAGRGGGFMLFEGLVPWASGFDVTVACVRQAVGLPVEPVRLQSKAVVLRFFPCRPGTVRDIQGFDEVTRWPNVRAAPFVRVGEKVGLAKTDGDRMGYLLTRGDTIAEAQTLAARVEAQISFRIEATDGTES